MQGVEENEIEPYWTYGEISDDEGNDAGGGISGTETSRL